MDFATFIWKARKRRGLEIEQVAGHVNMSVGWVRVLEEGHRASLSAKSKSLILYYIAGFLTEDQMLEGALLIAEEITDPKPKTKGRKLPPHKNRKMCPPNLVPLLGTMTDKEMGKRGKVSYSTARNWRLRHNVPAYQGGGTVNGVPREEVIKILGENTDPQAGKILGVTRSRIQQVRVLLNIPSATERRKVEREGKDDAMAVALQPFMDQLGQISDEDLAAKAAVTQKFVTATRLDRGIPYYNPLEEKMESVRHLMGEVSDTQLAKRLGVPPQSVTRYRNKWDIPTKHKGFKDLARIDWEEAFKMWKEGATDREIAEKVGSTRASVAQKRGSMGWVRSRRPGNSAIHPYRHLLRTTSDSKVAKMAGVGVSAVRQYRMKHNIFKGKGWTPQRREDEE